MLRIVSIVFILFLSIQGVFSQNEKLEDFYLKYKTGNYLGALQELELLRTSSEFEPTRHYLMALCYKGMQKHDKAIPHFKQAILMGKKSEDIFFEYGQSLFAVNDLMKAKRAFRISYKRDYKPAYSLYYIAHIGEILEDHGAVKKNFIKLIKEAGDDKEMQQVAFLRLAELIYTRTKDKFFAHNYISDYIVPLLDKGIEIDPKSKTAEEMRSRYDEILLKHNMHPLLLSGGRLLSRQGTQLIFTQNIDKDDNVTLQSDNPAVGNTTTDTSSTIYRSELFYSKRFVGGKHFVFTPELRLSYSEYANDTDPAIFQNDSYGISPAFRGSYNFAWNKKRGEILFELESNYTARDKDQVGERSFFGRSLTYVLGLRRRFIKNGDTTIRLRQRNLTSFSDAISGSTTSLYLDQLFVRENGHIMVGLFIADFYRPNAEINATDSYLFRLDYLMPRLFWNVDVNWSASVNMLDTKLQSETRGVERNTTFGLKVQRRFNKRWRLGVTYNYTKNDSADEQNFSYSKSVMGLELRYTWR